MLPFAEIYAKQKWSLRQNLKVFNFLPCKLPCKLTCKYDRREHSQKHYKIPIKQCIS